MLEHVLRLGQHAHLPDQILGIQHAERRADDVLRDGDALQQGAVELAPDHRGQPQHLLGLAVEPIDARPDHRLHRVGQMHGFDAPRQRGATVAHGDDVLLAQRAADLLDEQRVARSALVHHLAEIVGHECDVQRPGGHGARLLDGQRLEHDSAQLRRGHPGEVVFGPAQQDDHQRVPIDQAHEMFEDGMRGRVHPMPVLQHDHQRPPTRPKGKNRRQRFLERVLTLRPLQLRWQWMLGARDGQQVQIVGQEPLEGRVDGPHVRHDLVQELIRAVVLAQPQRSAQCIEERQVRRLRAVGLTPALDHADRVALQTAPELERDPALAYPRLTDHRDQLAFAVHDSI